jgi:hypothetical protein
MSTRIWRVALVFVTGLAVAATAATAGASAHGSGRRAVRTARSGPLSGTWVGAIGSGSNRQAMTITINAAESRGSWRMTARCYGTLTLDSISDGYHHFRRHAAAGADCAGGDVDCLKRFGAELYDAVTSRRGGAWDTSGTFRRGHA